MDLFRATGNQSEAQRKWMGSRTPERRSGSRTSIDHAHQYSSREEIFARRERTVLARRICEIRWDAGSSIRPIEFKDSRGRSEHIGGGKKSGSVRAKKETQASSRKEAGR